VQFLHKLFLVGYIKQFSVNLLLKSLTSLACLQLIRKQISDAGCINAELLNS